MAYNREVNATFVQDNADSDGDGLTNYQEYIVTYSTNYPNDSDSDDDGLSDSEEVSIGLNPNVANTSMDTYESFQCPGRLLPGQREIQVEFPMFRQMH